MKMSNLVDVWFTEEQLRCIRFALNSHKQGCGYMEREELDIIIEHINHILKDKSD